MPPDPSLDVEVPRAGLRRPQRASGQLDRLGRTSRQPEPTRYVEQVSDNEAVQPSRG